VVTKIEGGSGPDAPGNDALASVVTHIKSATVEQGATGTEALPSDFPGHQGVTVRPTPSGNELGMVKGGKSITYSGTGTSTDIIVASARAYVAAINRMVAHESASRA